VPLYAYHCDRCDLTAEVIQSHTAPPPEHCEHPMRLLPSASSFAFVTKGGNLFNFSGTGEKRRHRSKKVTTISKGHGLGTDKRRKQGWDPVREQVKVGLAEARVAALKKP
jgi:predicted nucleic acid-binding Zn ribbon protein